VPFAGGPAGWRAHPPASSTPHALVAPPAQGILPPLARHSLSRLVYSVFTPAIIFSKLGSSLTASRLVHWWPLPANLALRWGRVRPLAAAGAARAAQQTHAAAPPADAASPWAWAWGGSPTGSSGRQRASSSTRWRP
jgi:hypothetical protein